MILSVDKNYVLGCPEQNILFGVKYPSFMFSMLLFRRSTKYLFYAQFRTCYICKCVTVHV